MSDYTIHATMARRAHHERDTGAWKNSLRLRLLTGTLIWVLGALLLTGWGLRALFAEHLAQQLRSQLVAKLDRLSGAVSFQMDQPVQITVAPFSGDPLLQQPLSGMYWQVDQLDAAGQATVHAGIQRSRSLWDQTLDWPLFKADKTWEPTLPLHAPATYGHMSDGNGNGLVVVTRTVQLPEADAPVLRLMVAADTAMLAVPLQRFTQMLIAALCVLAAGLVVAVVVQLQLALAPLTALRRQLAAVSQGEAPEIQGEHPTEIMPLVKEFNHVLRMNAEMVERARTQAGNLAHAVNTPLSIMGNAAAQQDDALATLVREQVASASRQVEHHLARARAAAAAAQQGHGLRTSLEQPLQSLVRTMSKLHAARDIRFELQGDASGWDFKGDTQDLMEMLGNLLDNAGKWAQSRVLLQIQPAVDNSRYITLNIDDDGPGIAAEQRERIFMRGERLDEQRPGAGLGLDIVRDLVQTYGGSIEALSSPLGGLRMVLTLPGARRKA
ncbi:MAG: sensor histidine kinase [Comamonas sp.]